jgi:acyl-CoA thioesterase YciA
MSNHDNRYLALKTAMMPYDTNGEGAIFGGVLLSGIDIAGAVGAVHEIRSAGWPQQPIVTVAMDRVEFHEPCFVNDIVSYWTTLVRVGTTSITVHVIVECERGGKLVKLTEADVTYVAVKQIDGKQRPVPIRGPGVIV